MNEQLFTLEQLLDALRRYVSDNIPGRMARRFKLELDDGEKIAHPIPPGGVKRQGTRPIPRRHSSDFRCVHWHGEDYTFSPTQAAIVKSLWEAFEDGVPDVGQDRLLEETGGEANRLRDLFRNHAAWGTFIVPGEGRGAFRLGEEKRP